MAGSPKLIEMYHRLFSWWDFILLVVAVGHIFMVPYTKVEESFNVQAIHDLLYWKWDLSNYDHLTFPGVVPRTFIGAIVVATLSAPLVIPMQLFHLPKLYALYIVRMILAILTVTCLAIFRRKVALRFGPQVASAFAVVVLTEFHLLFYCSRALPNVFALAIVTLACAYWLEGRMEATIRLLVFAAIVFRCDMWLLVVPVGIHLLMSQSVPLISAIHCGLSSGVISLALTVSVDSVFWGRSIWPEGEVLWFNTVLNRSSEWGVSPAHWYFTSALVRSMLFAYPLAVVGVFLDRRLVPFITPVVCFIFLYSRLPHKELRFIFPALPMLNLSAAIALTRLYNNRKKPAWGMVFMGTVLLLLASASVSLIMAAASYQNYPGGYALMHLHSQELNRSHSGVLKEMEERRVHISVLPAMTGVSRFCELQGGKWKYSKEENIPPDLMASRNFTHLLSSQKTVPGYCCTDTVQGFSHIGFRFAFPPIELVQKPYIFLHRQRVEGMEEAQCMCKSDDAHG